MDGVRLEPGTTSKAVSIINKNIGLTVDWSYQNNFSVLNERALQKIQVAVAQNSELQKELVSLYSKLIKDFLYENMGIKSGYSIRVSAQVKAAWGEVPETKLIKPFYEPSGVYRESELKENFCFPTRPHQDLDNNGNRSSHVIIFYFPITDHSTDSSIMEIGKFEEKQGLLPCKKNSVYSNEINEKIAENLIWFKPQYNRDTFALMSSLTIHKSGTKALFPRVALNVKVQPTNLSYLDTLFSKSLGDSSSYNGNVSLEILEEKLEYLSKLSPGLIFERAISTLLLNNLKKAQEILSELLLFDASEEYLKRVLCAAILRKTVVNVTEKDFYILKSPVEYSAVNSCASAILDSVGKT